MNMKPTYVEKRLTETDLKRLIVSCDWLRNNEGRGVLPVPVPVSASAAISISVRDEWGRDYPLRLKVRSLKPGKRYYGKPEFMSKGWRAFVTDKMLQVGDKIFLWLDRGHIRVKVRNPPLLYRFSKGMDFLY